MKKTNYLFFFFLFFIFSFYFSKSIASEKKYLSLKKDIVNLRQGPSKDYPIKLVYNKKFLPVEILDSWENWRKIKDFEGNIGWIHTSLLSGKKSAISKDNYSIIFSSNTIYSKPLAKVEKGRLMFIKKCKVRWCKISSGKYVGWVKKNSLWGKLN